MITGIDLDKVLVFDIETVPLKPYSRLTDKEKELFMRWYGKEIDEIQNTPIVIDVADEIKVDPFEKVYNDKAALHPEFGRVVCISFAGLKGDTISVTTMDDRDSEMKLLADFGAALTEISKQGYFLGGHNIAEFDMSFLTKRYVIRNMPIPRILNLFGKKPWELQIIDTMLIWRTGNFKAKSASLDLLCHLFKIDSPKGEMDGSDVYEYYQKNKRQEIMEYCADDVRASFNVIRVMGGKSIITDVDFKYPQNVKEEESKEESEE